MSELEQNRSRHVLCYDMVTGNLELGNMCGPGERNHIFGGLEAFYVNE
jgi:hypothetical protein